jgi:drug/metabolite transporter (DMT)-like permease
VLAAWQLLAVSSALLLAFGNIQLKRVMREGLSHWSALTMAMVWGVLVLVPFSAYELSVVGFSSSAMPKYIMAGALQFFLSRAVYFKAVEMDGASTAAAASTSSEPVLTAILAVLVLGDAVGLRTAMAIAIITLSLLLLAGKSSSQASKKAVILGLLAGTLSSLTSILIRYTSLVDDPIPVTGVVLSQITALSMLLLFKGGQVLVDFKIVPSAVVTGVVLSLAQVGRFAALSSGPATEVTLLILMYPVFIVILSILLGDIDEVESASKVIAILGILLANLLSLCG